MNALELIGGLAAFALGLRIIAELGLATALTAARLAGRGRR